MNQVTLTDTGVAALLGLNLFLTITVGHLLWKTMDIEERFRAFVSKYNKFIDMMKKVTTTNEENLRDLAAAHNSMAEDMKKFLELK
jgi:hypothetical protein